MRIVGRTEKLGNKIFFLGRVIERTARGFSVEANQNYIQNVIAVLVDSEREEDANDRVTGRAGD